MHRTVTRTEKSSSELAECRKNLRNQWENRQVDEELLQRAWEAAHRVATVLYQDYGASKVAVFGSLAEQEWFHEHSDIDIAVWGIPHEPKLKTICLTLNNKDKSHRYDLIDYEYVNKYFRHRVIQQAIPIKKGITYPYKMFDKIYPTTSGNNIEIYMKYKNRFIQNIKDQRHMINCIVTRITSTMGKIVDNSVIIDNNTKTNLADDVAFIYKAIVKIFLWIILHVDCDKFPDDEYSNDLLLQMVEQKPHRPAVILHETALSLELILEFRNCVNSIDPIELENESILKHARQIEDVTKTIFEDLDIFVDFLSET